MLGRGQSRETCHTPFLRAAWSCGWTCFPWTCQPPGHLWTSPLGSPRSELLGASALPSLLPNASFLQEPPGPGYLSQSHVALLGEQSSPRRGLWGLPWGGPLAEARDHTPTVWPARAMGSHRHPPRRLCPHRPTPPRACRQHPFWVPPHTSTRHRTPESCSAPLIKVVPTRGCHAALPRFI